MPAARPPVACITVGNFFTRLFVRESAADRAEWLNSAVQAVGQRAYSTQVSTARQSRSFEAAETPAWTDSWPTHAAPINDDLSRQLVTLRARARGLARNNEWATNYLLKLDDNVLGENGFVLQMRLKNAAGEPDTRLNTLIETAWLDWCDKADVSGLTFREVETLALASLPQDGELLYRFRRGAGPYRMQLQILGADLLDVTLRRDWQGNRVRMGVEINDDGLPLAYWLLANRTGDQPTDFVSIGRHVRVPADEIRHCFVHREVGQLRGYPWLSTGARRLWMLHDFEEAAAVASTNAAKRQGFFYTPDGEAPSGFSDTIVSGVLEAAKAEGKTLTPGEIRAIVPAAEKYTTTLPGQYDTLPNGTQFVSNDSKWPDVSADAYTKSQVRGWAAARGISYVSLGNDLEAVNFSSAQVGIIEERKHYKTIQSLLKKWLHAQVLPQVMPWLIAKTPGLVPSDLDKYLAAVSWQAVRWSGIDPVKEATANEINLRLKLTSRRRIITERGDDPDEVGEEVKVEDELYGEIPHPVTGATPNSNEDEPKKGSSNA